MNYQEAFAGAESHYDRSEYIEAISLVLIGFALLVQEQADEPDWKAVTDFQWRSDPAWDPAWPETQG